MQDTLNRERFRPALNEFRWYTGCFRQRLAQQISFNVQIGIGGDYEPVYESTVNPGIKIQRILSGRHRKFMLRIAPEIENPGSAPAISECLQIFPLAAVLPVHRKGQKDDQGDMEHVYPETVSRQQRPKPARLAEEPAEERDRGQAQPDGEGSVPQRIERGLPVSVQ